MKTVNVHVADAFDEKGIQDWRKLTSTVTPSSMSMLSAARASRIWMYHPSGARLERAPVEARR